jgi:hypothetical protein
MEPEGPLPLLQKQAIGPYREPVEFIHFKIRLNISLSSGHRVVMLSLSVQDLE